MARLGCLRKGNEQQTRIPSLQHRAQWDARGLIPKTGSLPRHPDREYCGVSTLFVAGYSTLAVRRCITGSWDITCLMMLRTLIWEWKPQNFGTTRSKSEQQEAAWCFCHSYWLLEHSPISFARGWACTQQLLTAEGVYTHIKTFVTLYLAFKMEFIVHQ